MDVSDLYSQRFWTQAIALAHAARAVILIALKLFTNPAAIGLAVATFHVWNDPFKDACYVVNAASFVIAKFKFFLTRTVQKDLLNVGWKVFPFRLGIKLIMLGNGFNCLQKVR